MFDDLNKAKRLDSINKGFVFPCAIALFERSRLKSVFRERRQLAWYLKAELWSKTQLAWSPGRAVPGQGSPWKFPSAAPVSLYGPISTMEIRLAQVPYIPAQAVARIP